MQSARAALRHSLVSGGEAAFVIDSAAVASGVTRRAGSGRGVGAGRRTCASLSIAVSAADPARARAIGSAGERLVHTEEVTGSIPVSPTGVIRLNEKLAGLILHRDGAFRRAGEFSAASCRSCWKS